MQVIKKLFAVLVLMAGLAAVVGGGSCVIGLGGEFIRHPNNISIVFFAGIGLVFLVCGGLACKRAIATLNERASPDA